MKQKLCWERKKGLIKDCTDCQTYGFGCAGDTLLKAREWKGWHGVLKNNKELILASSRKRNAEFSKKCLGKEYKVIKVKVVEVA